MIAPLSKKALLAAAAAVSLLPASHAGLMNPVIDLQTYRDYAENRGVFKAGATNVTVYNADGSVNGVIAVVPDFTMVADIGATTLVGGSFGGSVAHYGTVTDNTTFAARFNDTGLAYSYFGDAYHPIVALSPGNDVGLIRYSKLVIDAAPATLVTDSTLLTSMTGKEITRVGSGRQSWAAAPGVEEAAAPPGYSSYGWMTGGFNKIDSMGTSTVTDNVNDGVTKTYQGYRYSYSMDATPATKMQIGTQDGDSGSPVFVWNANTGQYEVIAFNSSGSGSGIGKGTNVVASPQWMLDMMASYDMPTVSAASGGGVVTMSVTNASGAGTLTQGATTWNYTGLASGTTSATATDAQFEATRSLVFAGAGNTIRIAGNIDTGAGTMRFTAGNYIIDDGGVTTRRLNTAGYIVDSGASLTLRTTGSAGDDWRKTGAGTLAIEGSGNSAAKLSLGEGLVTLNRSGGYAVDDVLITSGRGTVRLLAANQIAGDISFGHLGGTLDIYGTSLSRATIYAMDTGAVITNTKANTTSTFTWTGSGAGLTQTFRGGFADGGSLANGLLNVVIAPATPSGSMLTLTGESTNAGGYTINGGEVVLRGYNTPHGGDGSVASAPPATPTPDDWTYASIATGTINVASGAKFTFADHARLDGNVVVAAGGTFAITENLFKSTAESVEGALPGTPSASLYGHQSGAVTLNGATAAMTATISAATDQSAVYSRNISGTGSFAKNGSGTLTLSGTNTFSGAKAVNAGALLGTSVSALGDTTTNKWAVAATGVIGATGAAPGTLKTMLTTTSSGTLAVMDDFTGAAPALTGYANLFLGSIDAHVLGTAGLNTSLTGWGGASGNDFLLGGGGGTLTVNHKMNGSGALVAGNGQNTGTVVVTRANGYTGGTVVNAGVTLRTTRSDGLGTGTNNLAVNYGGILSPGAGAVASAAFARLTSGSAGVFALTGADTNAYNLSAAGLNALALGADGTATYSGALTPGTGGYRFGGVGALTVNTVLSGAVAVTADGQGGSGGVTTLAGANTFTGPVAVQGGVVNGITSSHTLRAGSNGAFGTGNAVTLDDGGTIDLNGKAVSVGNITGSAASALTNSSATASTLTVAQTAATTMAGDLSGALALVKNGSSTLTLSGDNSQTGSITINAGAIKLGSATALGDAANATTVASGATLDTAGYSTPGNVSIAGAGVSGLAALYNSATSGISNIGTLTLTADATLGGVTNNNTGAGVDTGGINLAGRTLTIASGRLIVDGTAGFSGGGNIAITSGGVLYLQGAGAGSGSGVTITVKTGGTLDARDYQNSGLSAYPLVVLDGGTLSNALLGSNGGGAGTILYNPVSVTANGGTLNGNNTGYGLFLRLAGTLSGSGALTLAGGKGVEFRGDTAGYTGTATAIAGTVSFNPDAATQTFNGSLAGSRPVVKNGPNTTVFTGANTYTGGTTVAAGTLQLGDSATTDYGATGRVRGTLTANSGTTVLLNGTNALGWTAGAKVDTINLLGATLTHAGNGDNGWGVVYNLTGATMQVTGAGQFSFGNNTAVNTLASATASTIAGNVVLRESNTNNTTVFTVADGAAASDLNVTGTVSSGGAARGLTKTGAGVMTLSGANTYAGATIINAGALIAGSNTAFGTGAVTVNSGGTANLGGRTLANAFTVNSGGFLAGAGTVSGAVSVASGGRLAPGTSGGAAIQTFAGGVTLASGAIYAWDILGSSPAIAGTDFDKIVISAGTLSVNAGAILKIAASGIDYTGAFWDSTRAFTVAGKSGTGTITGAFGSVDTSAAGSFSSQGAWSVLTSGTGELQALWTPGSSIESIQAVPEPSTYGLIGAGAFAAVAMVRRRKRLKTA